MAHTDSASALHTPQLPPVTQTYNGPVESRDAGRCDSIAHIDESQLVRVPIVIAGDSQLSREIPASAPAVPVSDSGGVKRKRGRPPKGAQAKTPPVKKMKMKENDNDKDEEEDVCFICFDGGSLVLCDRRGCPKAYHVTCIKRDEAFFQSKAKWNCGWHICSICEKTSYYMCYTCTFSLCKGCTKDSDYVSVRGEKGFCSMCFKTIMLIENKDPGNKDAPQVDFDDKTSWEYLFKIYWVVLKQKLSLTLPELMQAKSPPLKAVTTSYRAQPARVQNIHNNGKIPIPNPPSTCLETKIPEEIKNKEPIKIQTSDPLTTEKRANDKGTSSIGSTVVPAAKSNVDEYAAVDIHNIKLIYLRRDLVANLFEDNNEKFHAKVVGSIVRIRVPSSHHKEDLYRLVKVVGTNKAAVPYNIGNKSLDVTLAVLNLGKQEDVLIDAISNNHDPSEEECKELRQNIKSGLVERWTVGEIRAKAMSLQAAMFKDWVETEIMRFNQLRDQASEQGQTKELRDCVERLQLLKSPEERRRRMCEAPEIHSDPKMDPYYYGPDDDEADCNSNKKQDKMEVSPKVQRVKEGKDTSQSNNTSERQGDESGTVGMSSTSVNDQATTVGPIPTITSETSTTPLSTESTPPANESEAEKLWHYRDLNGQTQGPFSMLQLQKWSTTGYFPPDMRIWASSQDDSVLLSDALDGQLLYNISVQFKEVGGENINANRRDNTKNKELNSNTLKESKNHSSSNGETDIRNQEMIITSNKQEEVKADSNTSSQTQVLAPNSVEPSMSSEGTHAVVSQAEKSSMSLEWAHAVVPQTGKPSMSLEGAHAVVPQTGKPSMSLEGAHAVVPQTGKPQEVELKLKSDLNQENWNSCGPSTSSAEAHVTVTQTKKPQEVVTKLESDLNQLNWNSHGTTTSTTTTTTTTVAESSSVNENQSNPENFPGQSSGQSWRPLPLNFFPNNFESSGRNTGVDIPDLHSPAPKTSSGGWESQSQTVENKHSVSVTSAIPVLEPVTVDLPILTLKMSNEDQNEQEAENIQNKQQSLSMNFPVQDSGPSWAHNTSLEADKWGGYFSNTMKPSIEEWDSGPAMLKPHEALGDNHVSLSSRIDQLFHSPRSNPTSSWQMGFNERIEFSTLAEESVSDLLAEVDAMENQGGLPSPTSVMKSGEELIHGPKHDYFGNMEEEFSPTLDVVNPVKTEAMTLTGDIHLPSHSIRGDPVGSYFDPLKGSSTSAQSSTRAEVYRDTKPTHFPFRSDHDMSDMESRKSRSSKSKSTRGDSLQRAKGEEETKLNLDPNLNPNGLYLQIPPSFNTGHDMVDSSNTHRSRTESMDTDWLKIHQSSEKAKADGRTSNRVPSPLNISRRSGPQEQIDSGWDPLHGNLNQGYQGMSRGSGSIDHVSPGSRVRESRKHGGDRLTSPRDRVSSHGRDSGRDSRGSKSSWSRQSSGGGGNGGYSSSRHTPRGQRVCKFYERGDCRKGALCDYFHP